MSAANGIHRIHRDGIDIRIRLTPNAGQDAVEGPAAASDGSRHLAVRVRAVPEKGAANIALERLIARWLDVPRSTVSVTAGGKSRIKTVTVAGDAGELAVRIERLITPD